MYKTPSLYQALNNAITQAKLLTDPAEIHGIMVGQICGGAEFDSSIWRSNLNDLTNNSEALPKTVQDLIEDLRLTTCNNLLDEDLGFAPFLPDETLEFSEQAHAFSQWIYGFMAGLACIKPDISAANDDLQEAIRDLNEIALLNPYELQSVYNENLHTTEQSPEQLEEDALESLIQLKEYARLVAMMTFAEYGASTTQITKPTIH